MNSPPMKGEDPRPSPGHEDPPPLGVPSIALVRPPILSTAGSINNEATPSIAFAYLAAALQRHGFPFHLIDGIALGLNRVWPVEELPGYICQGLPLDDIIARIPPDVAVIGFSAMFSGEWPLVRRFITRVRQGFPHALFIAGGEHVTALAEESLEDCPALDLCVLGEGEDTLIDLMQSLAAGASLDGVAGIVYRDAQGQFRRNPPRERIRDIARVGRPLWPEGYLEQFWAAGKSYGVASLRDMPIMVSRGCPYRCTFCSSPNMWTTRYILREVDDVMDEIKGYVERYAITSLQFYDLTAIVRKSWLVDFATRLEASGWGLKWSLPSGTRSEALDRESLALMNRTGCSYLVYAPESGSEAVLKRIKKRIHLGRFTESVRQAHDEGMVLRTNLIIGFPEESRKEMWQTVRYGMGLAVAGADEVSINIFSPYPGTELFAALRDQGRVVLGDAYYLGLTSLNSDYTRFDPISFNDRVSARELAYYRVFFMSLNYIISYLFYPWRILRTLRNLWRGDRAATVLEHRLQDLLKRRREAAGT